LVDSADRSRDRAVASRDRALIRLAAARVEAVKDAFEWIWTNAKVELREPRRDDELNELSVDIARKRLLAHIAQAGKGAEQMKFIVERYGIEIVPENKEDEAYIEDTLGLKKDFDSVPLVRQNAIGMSCMGLLTTHPLRKKPEEPSK
jgi:hypothetical protein